MEDIINEFSDKFITVEGHYLILKSQYGEFEEWLKRKLRLAKQEERERVKGIIEKMASDWDGSGSAKVQLALNDVLSELKEEK